MFLALIRVLTISLSLFFVVKIFDVIENSKNILTTLEYGPQAVAQQETPAPESPPKTEDAKSESSNSEGAVSIDEVKKLTDEEIQILQRLVERKKRLIRWEEELEIKDNVLALTEERIDKKLEELRKLKKAVELSLNEYSKVEEEKTQSLVKIYENMKAKNAADILSKMKTEEALPIFSRMKEKNAADILSKMDPRIAQEITSALNQLGKLQNPE
ncbi:MAG: hypothetical protein SFT90_03395 [Rickettsiales bacterium]|nr:hypothetical protein [Rickettsiales bacterium]